MTSSISSWAALLSLLGGCCGHYEPKDFDTDVGSDVLAEAEVTDTGVLTDAQCADVCGRVAHAQVSEVWSCSLTVEAVDAGPDSGDTSTSAELNGHLTCNATPYASCL